MPTIPFNYPLDLDGTSSTNRVVNEEYVIGSVRGRIFATQGGPFFGNGTTLYDIDNDRVLVPRVDYYLIHFYQEAADRADQPVYAAVRIVNQQVGTRIGLTTQYIGGEFSYSYSAIADAIRTLEEDGRPVNWGDLVGLPAEFNPTHHLHDIRNSYNWNSVVLALARLEEAILNGNTTSMSLLVDTIQQKLLVMDQFRDDIIAAMDQLRIDIDQEFADYDVTVGQYLTDFKSNLLNYLKPTVIKSGSYTLGNNRIYTIYPSNANTVEWTTTLNIPSTVVAEDGDYIELFPARDGCTVDINALNGPVRQVILNGGVKQLVNTTNLVGIPLDKAGIKLYWDTRNGTWNLSRNFDPETIRFNKYNLSEVTTSGLIDLSKSNCFILSAVASRQVSISNIPTARSLSITIMVLGNNVVYWPAIEWANGSTPVLDANKTLVTLYRTNSVWVGSWSAVP